MKISLSWLSEYVEIQKYKPEDLAQIFTSLGIEVEKTERVALVEGDVVVGKITETSPHPNADSLQLCKVDTGNGEILDIVCGGRNARTGLWVAVAKIGAKLPGDLKIKPAKIRGVPSSGMLCGAAELGIGPDEDGIMELSPEKVKLGQKLSELYDLEDTVFELSITPNRSDCLGYIGLARDLSAKLGLPLKKPKLNAEAHDINLKSKDFVKVELENNEACGRFCALVVRNIKTMPSPHWLQTRLLRCGMRPINLIVDVTNYVMLEYSQPIHAYDARDIDGNMIIVRDARQGEKLITLDGEERTLEQGDIVITDEKKVIGLAGIMGGHNSEIKDDTKDIIIEVASFHPVKVRKTAKRLGIHSEASHRFERGTDIDSCDEVAHRVASLIATATSELNPQHVLQISGEIVDNYPKPFTPSVVALRIDRLRQISGSSRFEEKNTSEILTNLGFQLLDQKDGRMVFQIPSWRHDITREIDLVEEAMRVDGYENIIPTLPVMELKPLKEASFVQLNERIRTAMAAQGFNETMSFPFMAPQDLDGMLIPKKHPMRQVVRLKNPIVAEENLLQTSLLSQLLKALGRNLRQGINGVRLFECARHYFDYTSQTPPSSGYFASLKNERCHLTAKANSEERPTERPVIAAVIGQPYIQKSWDSPEKSADFFTGKEKILSFLASLGVRGLEFRGSVNEDLPFLHPGASALILKDGMCLGFVGELHPRVTEYFDLDPFHPPVVMEILLDELLELTTQQAQIHTEQSKFPPSLRDLAFTMSRDITYAQVEKTIQSFRKRNLKTYQLFDVYTGENIAKDRKSLGLSFAFQSDKRTLNDKEIDQEITLLIAHFAKELGAELR